MLKPASVFALAALALPAASYAAEVRPTIVTGLDFGGEKIITVNFSNGDTESIHANEGVYLGGGVSVLNDDKTLEFLGLLKYEYRAIHASNGDITWTRVPLDALFFYRWEKFRAGGGLTYVTSPKLKVSGIPGGNSVDVDNAVGLVLQGDYLLLRGKMAIGLRATFIQYKAGGQTASGNGAGVTFGYSF